MDGLFSGVLRLEGGQHDRILYCCKGTYCAKRASERATDAQLKAREALADLLKMDLASIFLSLAVYLVAFSIPSFWFSRKQVTQG